MTIREAATQLGVSEKVIRGRIERGEIPVRKEPFSGGFRYILDYVLDIDMGEEPREAPGEPGVEVLVDILRERDARIIELQERLEEVNRYWGVDRGRLEEVEKQVKLLVGPKPSLVERVKKALWGGS